MVALTLPDDALQALRDVHPDTGWAIVKLLERGARARMPREKAPDAELLHIGHRRSLIVVNPATMPSLAGVEAIAWSESRAFLALEPGRSMADLELAVIDRLADRGVPERGRQALLALRRQLAAWRRDRRLQIRSHAIIVLEQPRSARRRKGAA